MATWSMALHISKAFDRVQHAGLLHKLKFYGISIDGKCSQEYPVNAGVPQVSLLGCYL